MLEFTKGADGTIRFEGMTRDEVSAEADRVDPGGPGPDSMDMPDWVERLNRAEYLLEVLDRWPS